MYIHACSAIKADKPLVNEISTKAFRRTSIATLISFSGNTGGFDAFVNVYGHLHVDKCVNWRSGVVAAAPATRRVPRAPLAAVQAVPAAIVDEAIVRVSRDLSSKPDGTTSALINELPAPLAPVGQGATLSMTRSPRAR